MKASSHKGVVRNKEITKFSEENSFLEIAGLSPFLTSPYDSEKVFSFNLSVREPSISFQICTGAMASFPSGASRVV